MKELEMINSQAFSDISHKTYLISYVSCEVESVMSLLNNSWSFRMDK